MNYFLRLDFFLVFAVVTSELSKKLASWKAARDFKKLSNCTSEYLNPAKSYTTRSLAIGAQMRNQGGIDSALLNFAMVPIVGCALALISLFAWGIDTPRASAISDCDNPDRAMKCVIFALKRNLISSSVDIITIYGNLIATRGNYAFC